jgi:hypothetical protein
MLKKNIKKEVLKMAEGIFKQSRKNTYVFEGHAVITDNSFTINKTNEKGTWVYNSLNFGIDCGDHGINYVNLMGGYNPKGGSYVSIQKIGEDGSILSKEHNLQIDWEDRLDFDFEADENQNINKSSFVKVSLEKDSEGKSVQKMFITPYDAIEYIKANIEDKMPVVVRGHMEYRLNSADEWIPSHIVDSISIRKEEFLQPKTVLDLMVLIDNNTLGKPNIEERNVPLYVKSAYYINKVGQNVYKQSCAIPFKILFDINSINLNDEKDRKRFDYGVKHYFSPEEKKKDFTSELLFRCHYSGGVKKVEVSLDVLPTDIREGIEAGFISEEQVMNGMAIQGPQSKDIIFDTVLTRIETHEDSDGSVVTIPKIVGEFSKYKNSEIVMFEDLEPIETSNQNTAPVDNTLVIDDEEMDKSATDILALFSSMGN